jgi:tetratricopeptide (TPR) repeat protein
MPHHSTSDQQIVCQALAIFGERGANQEEMLHLLAPFCPTWQQEDVLQHLAEATHAGTIAISQPGPLWHLLAHHQQTTLNSIPLGEPSDAYEAGAPLFTQYGLWGRAIRFYQQKRLPRKKWLGVEDLKPQLAEFDMLCRMENYEAAALLLGEFSYSHLLKWGAYELVAKMRERLAQHLENAELRQINVGELGTIYGFLGDEKKALSYHEEALAIARQLGQRSNEGVWLNNLGNRHYYLGDIQRAQGYYKQALAIAKEEHDRTSQIIQLNALATCRAQYGDWEAALGHYQEGLAISRELQDIESEGNCLGNMAIVYMMQGNIVQSIALHDQRLAIAQQSGALLDQAKAMSNMAEALILLDQFEEAEDLLKKAIKIDAEAGYVRGLSFKKAALARLHYLKDSLEEGHAYADEARLLDVPQNNADAWLIHGLILARLNRWPEATKALQTSIVHNELLLKRAQVHLAAYTTAGLAMCGLALIHGAKGQQYATLATSYFRTLDEAITAPGARALRQKLFAKLLPRSGAQHLAEVPI